MQAWQRALAWPPSARLTPAQDLHLTMVFIGELPVAQLPAVMEAAASVPARELALSLDTLLTWRGGTVVLSASQLPPPLADWQHGLVHALAARGVAVDARAFHPHVTLARKGQGVALPSDGPPPAVSLRARGLVLAARQGAHYGRLWPASGAESA